MTEEKMEEELRDQELLLDSQVSLYLLKNSQVSIQKFKILKYTFNWFLSKV